MGSQYNHFDRLLRVELKSLDVAEYAVHSQCVSRRIRGLFG